MYITKEFSLWIAHSTMHIMCDPYRIYFYKINLKYLNFKIQLILKYELFLEKTYLLIIFQIFFTKYQFNLILNPI